MFMRSNRVARETRWPSLLQRTLVHFLTGNDVLKLIEDESFEAESSSDSDESEDYICNLSDSDDGWNSDHLNSQLNHGDLGVVDDVE